MEEFEKSMESIANSGSNSWGINLWRDLVVRVGYDLFVVNTDKRWAPAREPEGYTHLFEAASFASGILYIVAQSLEIANEGTLRAFDQVVFQHAVKIAKAANKRLRDLCGPPKRQTVPPIWRLMRKMNEARAILDCAEAWLEALSRVRGKAKGNRLASTRDAVEAVIDEDPELDKRLRLADVIENATAKGIDVFDLIRSSWRGVAAGTKKRPRTVAFELAGLACGVDSTDTVRHLRDFAKAAKATIRETHP